MKTRITSFFPFLPIFLTSLTFLSVISAQTQVPSYVPTNGLVGYWPFNGNANDESGNGNNGTVNGAMLAADRFGDSNKSYFFSGINCDPRIDANVNTSSINSSNEYSISIWINKNGDGCMSQPRILEFYSTTNGALQFNWDVANGVQNSLMVETINSSGLYQSVSFIYSDWLNNWNNIVFTARNGEANLFLNGELMNAFVFQGLPSLSGDVSFGRMNHPSFNSMNGNLDDIALWNRSLTAGEVLLLYNGCNLAPLAVSGNVTPTQFTQETYTYPNTVGSSYNWSVTNGVIVSGQGTNSIVIMWANTGIGEISVAETNATNCTGDVVTYDLVIIPTNVEELSNAMILYPNPVTTNLTLQVKSEMIGSDFVVFDALGKVVLRDKILSSNQNISVINLSNGNYILRVGEMKEVFTISK